MPLETLDIPNRLPNEKPTEGVLIQEFRKIIDHLSSITGNIAVHDINGVTYTIRKVGEGILMKKEEIYLKNISRTPVVSYIVPVGNWNLGEKYIFLPPNSDVFEVIKIGKKPTIIAPRDAVAMIVLLRAIMRNDGKSQKKIT